MDNWLRGVSVIIVGLVLLVIKTDSAADDLVVEILQPYGRVRGHTLKAASGKEYYAFQEIPYALAPIGKHRFQVPKRHNDWHDILNATSNAKICMQTLTSNPLKLNITEDCLYLNIYLPQKPTNASDLLPVLLWVHPGDFISGAGIYQYWGPQYFIDYGVIIVTMNYRLGPFGFLWAGDEIIPGNLGLRDQLWVFNWLMTNVQQFGGNPFNIAFVGQGSGAASVSYHIINSRARDSIFSSAIMQSGTSLAPYYYQREPQKHAFQLGKKLYDRFNSNDTQDLRDLLLDASAEDIQKYGEEIRRDSQQDPVFQNFVWLPVVEGYWEKNGYLQWEQLLAYSQGAIRISPFMVGFTSEEMINVASLPNFEEIAEAFDNDSSLLVSDKLQISIDRKELGALIKSAYTNTSFKQDPAACIKYLSDRVKLPILKQAYNSSWYNQNLIYQFSYKGKLGGAMDVPNIPGANNVAHGEELKYLWDDGTNSDPSKFTEADRLTQKRLLTLWTNFIKTTHVTPNEDVLLENITWPYIQENTTLYLDIDTSLQIKNDSTEFNLLNDIIDKYIREPLTIFF